MRFLGPWLDLAEGARLTGLGLMPVVNEATDEADRVVLHRVRIASDRDAASLSGALAAFLPTAVATLDGNEPDGGAWCAVFQYVPAPVGAGVGGRPRRPGDQLLAVAEAALGRALDLTGGDGQVRSAAFTDAEIRALYDDAGADVAGWTLIDLLVGLLCELATGVALDVLVEQAADADVVGFEQREHRIEVMRDRLRGWAASHGGPDV